MKGAGVINWPPVIAWFVSSKWQLALGLCPTYWSAKFYWALEEGSAWTWAYFAIGVAYLAALTALLQRRFQRQLERG